ncbi:MAG: carboxypeptidase-like regulatory domain-containing protein [Deltaproteobacteria bacterium]
MAQTGAYLPIRTSRRKDTPAAGDLSLRGSLVDSMGAPLAGVVVSTRGPNGIREQTLTAEDGTFHLENLVAGRVVVRTARTATARGTRSHITLAGVGTESLDIVARSRN